MSTPLDACPAIAGVSSHPFSAWLNQALREQGFDDFAEAACAQFYATTLGRPSLAPGICVRLLMVG